jgi:NAD(P)-dependent dehydrogenase (short-subunit alcohol dehydrogenase family)
MTKKEINKGIQNYMKIAVIDGQGGGIGKHIVGKLRKHLPEGAEIIALGTNSLATAAMMKAGANDGATGENAIVFMVNQVDILVGSVAIMAVNAMLGEITPKMAGAIANSKAQKFLLPVNRLGIEIIGANNEPLPHQIEKLVGSIKRVWRD